MHCWAAWTPFYDKLLCVPALNLSVRALDRASIALSAWLDRQKWVTEGKLRPLQALSAWTPRQANFGFMADLGSSLWIHVCHGLYRRKAPGQRPRRLGKKPARRGTREAAEVLAHILDVQCQHNSASGCFTLGTLLSDGKGLPRDPIGAGRSFKQACDLGLESACSSLVNMVHTDGDGVLLEPCSHGDGRSCFMLGSLYYGGQGVGP